MPACACVATALVVGLVAATNLAAANAPYFACAVWLVVIRTGFALPCLSAELSTALPPQQVGVTGSLQSIARELGSTLGVVGTILTNSFTANLPAAAGNHEPAPHKAAEALAATSGDR
ncbi:hypothetical protein [Lentzea sp. NPDC060358]|uniref:hypothetical protein n=1 Tax=Lentzea sp. NPDC060358 TaxID=3347103 RepID=UPI0036569163